MVLLRNFYEYALELETSLCELLSVLCSPDMNAVQHLETKQVGENGGWGRGGGRLCVGRVFGVCGLGCNRWGVSSVWGEGMMGEHMVFEEGFKMLGSIALHHN